MPKKRYIAAKKARKRKRFCGNKIPNTAAVTEITENNRVVNTVDIVVDTVDTVNTVNIELSNNAQTNDSSLQPQPSTIQALPLPVVSPVAPTPIITPTTTPAQTKILNKSKEKLKNSRFKTKFIGRTRFRTISLGIRKSKQLTKAHSYKLIDADLMRDSVSGMICRKCHNTKSKFDLLENQSDQKGLCEVLSWKCLHCLSSTPFQTSKRCNKSINCYDVNLRSVMAAQQIGHSGLQKFCGSMDMTAPVLKHNFNKIQTKLQSRCDRRKQRGAKKS